MTPVQVTFIGGDVGQWTVDRIVAVASRRLDPAARVAVYEGDVKAGSAAPTSAWVLRGTTGPDNYATSGERSALDAIAAPLGRPSATTAVLIPIRKTAAWWDLTQEERRAIFEERSHHMARSLPYLPRIARRLHHSRQLGEPFDFLTWFEFAPADSSAFDELLGVLRSTEEWTYVEREVEIRLTRRSEPAR